MVVGILWALDDLCLQNKYRNYRNYRNWDKLRPEEPLGSYADFTYLPIAQLVLRCGFARIVNAV